MDYVNFGSTGLKVSQLALGLGLRGQADEAAAQRAIEEAIERGINLIDCANIYGPQDDRSNAGQSEIVLGRALQGRRDNVVITSKVASRTGHGPNDSGLSRGHILREIERSLKRLNTDYIDVYLVHTFDLATPLDETVRALDDLVSSGKVRYIGCCNFTSWQVCKALWIADRLLMTPFMAVQNQYNLLNRHLEAEMFGLIRDQGLGAMAYSPLAIGLLSGLYSSDEPAPAGSYWSRHGQRQFAQMMAGQAGEIIRTVKEYADVLGATPAQVALAWVISHPEITCAIMGGDTVAHLHDNLGALEVRLDDEMRRHLDVVSRPPERGLLHVVIPTGT
ncbi:MAG: aldo/keto reductase [Caldilineaceae bacterium]|nr:aldo/keto reductase [Caldilineaceae bacterium]